ncbi:MAG TPA: hypothetical protein VEZ42_02470 [Pseudonocardia sp.]|nr:hypothetical protein [Pseudonocardia sp.]
MEQVLDVIRIQTINWRFRVAVPLGLLAVVFGINYALFVALGDPAPPGGWTTGAVMSVYSAVFGTYLQTMTQLFPFALGLGVTRRAFYAGVALLVAVESVAYGVLLTALSRIEVAAGGWGIDMSFFALEFLRRDDPVTQVLVFAAPFAVLSMAATVMGLVFKRWGALGVWAVLIALIAVVGGAAVLITWRSAWPAVGTWFAGQPLLALTTGYPLVLAVLLGGLGWLAIRRATP